MDPTCELAVVPALLVLAVLVLVQVFVAVAAADRIAAEPAAARSTDGSRFRTLAAVRRLGLCWDTRSLQLRKAEKDCMAALPLAWSNVADMLLTLMKARSIGTGIGCVAAGIAAFATPMKRLIVAEKRKRTMSSFPWYLCLFSVPWLSTPKLLRMRIDFEGVVYALFSE